MKHEETGGRVEEVSRRKLLTGIGAAGAAGAFGVYGLSTVATQPVQAQVSLEFQDYEHTFAAEDDLERAQMRVTAFAEVRRELGIERDEFNVVVECPAEDVTMERTTTEGRRDFQHTHDWWFDLIDDAGFTEDDLLPDPGETIEYEWEASVDYKAWDTSDAGASPAAVASASDTATLTLFREEGDDDGGGGGGGGGGDGTDDPEEANLQAEAYFDIVGTNSR